MRRFILGLFYVNAILAVFHLYRNEMELALFMFLLAVFNYFNYLCRCYLEEKEASLKNKKED